MANKIEIYPQQIAPFGVLCATTAYARDTTPSFQSTAAGSGWSVGADLGPTAYADNGAGLVRVTMASTATLATGDSVYITGTTAAVYDGFWTVTVIDATRIDLQASTYSVNPAAKGTLKETLRYNWLVVGWRTADEGDAHNAYSLNSVRTASSGFGASAGSTIIYENAMNGLRPTATTDEMFLIWTLPLRIKFHHISIYFQTSISATTYNPTLLASKALPSSGSLYGTSLDGNIPGWATRAKISSPTAHTYTRQVPIMAKELVGNVITIFGDKRHCFANSSAVILLDSGADSGATTVSGNPTVDYTDNGEVTLVTVAANIGDATLGTFQYSEGPFIPTANGSIAATGIVTINISEDMQLQPKRLAELDWQGNAASVDYLNDCPIDAMLISVPTPGLASADDLYKLHKWNQLQTPVAILQTNNAAAIVYPHSWSGRVLAVPHTGGIRKHASGGLQLQLLIDGQINYRDEFRWFGVLTATGASTLTVEGDVRKWLPVGTAFYVKNSTGNDGLWVVSTITYSEATDISTITPTGSLPDGTDDGYIEVYNF